MVQNVDQNKKNNMKGFTVMELLIALVIFSLVFIFMLQSFLLAFKINFSNEVKNTAVRVAQEEVENLRNTPLSDIYDAKTGNVLHCPPPCTTSPADPNCKVVRVIKGANITFGKAISITAADVDTTTNTTNFLDVNLTVCTDVNDWRIGNKIQYTIRTILSNIGE